ncbi:MAG: glycosyltransferase [Desulfovibrio sp.]|jgi:GT2 family glycosyltransferase|nr:glycosyltransferase [Desulfovibrio sp.]
MLSFVTYTFNDHDFVLDMLKAASVFARPDEIIVVDDGSAVPFPQRDGVRVVRPERNLGPARAKSLGIGAARGDVVFSLDCDIRPDRRWLHNALPLLADPKVALVGATIVPALADNYLSRALHKLTKPVRKNRPALFAQAGCWLFRRALWESLGGLEGHDSATHEDVRFSVAAVRAGYTLVLADKYPVYERRRLHRTQYWRRGMAYMLVGRFRTALRERRGPELAALRAWLETALRYGVESGELAFLYIEIVKVVAFMAQALNTGADMPPEHSSMTAENVIAATLDFFGGYPSMTALMREDLAALGFSVSGADAFGPQCPCLRDIFTAVLPPWALAEIDAVWAAKLRREDAEKLYDFHYGDRNANLLRL